MMDREYEKWLWSRIAELETALRELLAAPDPSITTLERVRAVLDDGLKAAAADLEVKEGERDG